MEFHRHVPGPPLDRFVDHFWLVAARGLPHPRQVLFPDGGITVHFNFADPPGLADRTTGEVRRFATSWISGERTLPYTLVMPENVRTLGIRFRPGAAFPFLGGIPAHDVTGRVVELADVIGPIADETLEEMGDGLDPSRVFRIVEAVLLDRLARATDPGIPAPVSGGLAALDRAGPGASVVRMAAELGVSHRTLLRLFERWVGVTPKTIQRVLRFQRVVAWEDSRPGLDWSRVAYACGYCDQAHLIRDFKIFTGATPTQYRAARLEYPNYMPDPA